VCASRWEAEVANWCPAGGAAVPLPIGWAVWGAEAVLFDSSAEGVLPVPPYVGCDI